MKSIKYFFITFVCIFLTIKSYSQTPIEYVQYKILNSLINESKHYAAQEYIQLSTIDTGLSGFSFDANTGAIFIAEIDESIILPCVYIEETEPFSTSLNVGTIPGSADVTPTGAATYTIPITVAPGTAGMQPNLSIVYNSQAGNGMMGVGWNLSGISVISRTGATIYHDKMIDGVDFDDNDQLMLNGQRLIITSSNSTGRDYRTEIETFNKIRANSSIYTPFENFIITTKDNSKLYYGFTSNSCIESQNDYDNKVFWLLNKAEDRNKNYMEYTYLEREGTFYPSEIKYTFNDAAGFSSSDAEITYNSVKFYYAERKDVSKGYVGGGLIEQKLLLSKIVTYCDGERVNTYEFRYKWIGDEFSQLAEIVFYNSGGEKYNSTKIDYEPYNYNLIGFASFLNEGDQYLPLDYNADGLTDYISFRSTGTLFNPKTTIDIYKSTLITSTSYTDARLIFDYSIDFDGKYQDAISGDFDGDGSSEILIVRNNDNDEKGNKHFYIYDKIDGHNPTINNFLDAKYDGHLLSADFNGDGISDFLFEDDNVIKVCIFDDDFSIAKHLAFGVKKLQDIKLGDFNGDGIQDIYTISNALDEDNLKIYDVTKKDPQLVHSSNIVKSSDLIYLADFNGDSKSDILYFSDIGNKWGTIWYSTGTSFFFLTSLSRDDDELIFTGDIDGNGKDNLVIIKAGDDITIIKNFETEISTDLSYDINIKSTHVITQHITQLLQNYNYVGDINGDGKDDILGLGEIGAPSYIMYFQSRKNPYLVNNITNGLDIQTKFEYKLLTDNLDGGIYTKDQTIVDDVTTYTLPLWVVSKMQTEDGIGGWFENTYKYENLQIHRKGKGLLGFKKFIVTNTDNNMISETEFEYNTTYFNVAIKRNVIKNSTITFSSTTYTNLINWNSGVRIFPYIYKIEQNDNQTNTTIKSTFNYEQNGNLLNSTIEYGNGTKTITTNTYTNIGSWIPYLIKTSDVVKKRKNVSNFTQRTEYNYYDNGLLLSVVSNQGDQDFETTTSFSDYNSFGLPLTVSVKAKNALDILETRTSTFIYEDKGRSIIQTTNPIGQYSTSTYDYTNGNILTETDINNHTTTYNYNNSGVNTSIIYPDNTSVSSSVNWYESDIIVNALYYTTTTDIDGTNTKTYFDGLGREVMSESTGFDGNPIFVVTKYDSEGRLKKVSEPCTDPDATPKYIEYSYYENGSEYKYGKLKSIKGINNTTEYDYSCNSVEGQWEFTTKTDLKNLSGNIIQSSSQIKCISGEVLKAIDAGGTISYTYFASGLPKNANYDGVETSFTYFKNGLQESISDPDAGLISYEYDGFGNLIKQIDANGKYFTMKYDLLDRLISKTDNEGNIVTYTYDTQSNGKGLIANITEKESGDPEPKITETYSYDSFSRLISQTTNFENTNYTYSYTYDNLGRIETETYPSGFKIENSYNSSGYLEKIYKFGETTPLWTLNSMNIYGQITNTSTKNGLVTDYMFNPTTHMPESITVADGTTNKFYQSYNFEASTGNLENRTYLKNDDYIEKFGYDELQRLETINIVENTTLNIIPLNTLNYYSNGNIKTTSDLGQFTYLPTQPHAVVKIENSEGIIPSFDQDIKYNNFNKVYEIKEHTKKLEFVYGIDQQRIKTIYSENDEVVKTKYFFGSYEKEIDADGNIKEINYISTPSGLSAVCIKEDGIGKMYYLHQDYLGSICAITDEDKNLVQSIYYSAWGVRELLAGGTITDEFFLDRGYTTHEHLDDFGLINMNGRLYDPIMCRMLSPDNYVQAAGYTQSFNRYSYCLNNPLKYTDPSGDNPLLIPVIIGAAIGAYQGYQIGTMMGATGWEMAGYIAGGAVIGGASAYLGASIAATNLAYSKTFSIMFSSSFSSMGMSLLSGGRTDVTISLGVASYNITQNEWGYLGKNGNTFLENTGYTLGLINNLPDIATFGWDVYGKISNTGISGNENVQLFTKFDGKWGHSQMKNGNGDFVSVHPGDPQKYGVRGQPLRNSLRNLNINKFEGISEWRNTELENYKWTREIYGSKNGFDYVTGRIQNGKGVFTSKLFYSIPFRSCASYTSRALNLMGYPVLGFHPSLLFVEMTIIQNTIYFTPLLTLER